MTVKMTVVFFWVVVPKVGVSAFRRNILPLYSVLKNQSITAKP
jgi:hypothetical protein